MAFLIEDVQGLLLSRYAFEDTIRRWHSKEIPTNDLNGLIVATTLESLERDIISTLYRLDADEHVSYHSVKKCWAELDLTGPENDEIAASIKHFRSKLSAVKTRRNDYIAHVVKRFDGTLPSPIDFGDLIDTAVDTLSIILGEPFRYTLDFPGKGVAISFNSPITETPLKCNA